MEKINFSIVNKNSELHIKLLYKLLKSRKFTISHEKLPDYDSHKKFVLKNSYRTWNIIKENNKILGTFYITLNNEVGINLINPNHEKYVFIIKKILKNFSPLEQVNSVRSRYFLFNTNPNNSEYIKSLQLLKITHIQNTYACKKKID